MKKGKMFKKSISCLLAALIGSIDDYCINAVLRIIGISG